MSRVARDQAKGVLAYIEGWLWGAAVVEPKPGLTPLELASEYIREHADEILDQMVEDECAEPDSA